MRPSTATMRRGLFAAVVAAGLCGAGSAAVATPVATGSADPCAASEVARTIGSVAKSTGDYLDSHPETNQAMTSALQAGPQSLGSLKTYFEANPKVATDMQGLATPLNKLGTQCRLPISLPQALSMVQAAQGAGGLPALAAGGLAAGGVPATGGVPASGTVPVSPPAGTGPMPAPLPGPPRAGN
jgi:hemophore